MKKAILVLTLAMTLASSNANAMGREFYLSVIYGTLAGTLVGAATLAFTSNPGDNFNNVARGASYGLYAGILLGLWVESTDTSDGGEQKMSRFQPREGFQLSLAPVYSRNSAETKITSGILTYNF